MELKQGFKNTDAGIIPDDWNAPKLLEIADFENGKAHEQYIDDKGDYIVVNSKFISQEGEIVKFSNQNLSPLEKGNIAIVMSDIPNGRALAKCLLIDKDNRYTLNQRIGCIKPHDEIDNRYLFYKLNRNKYFLSFDSGSGQTNLKKSEILDCPVGFPPTKAEQTAIATALNEADVLINALEKLIAKKQAIKQGAIQELMKPKEDWEVKKLGEIADVVGGGTPSTFNPTFWNGEINWFTPTEVGDSKYSFESNRKITDLGFAVCSAKMLPIGSILLTSRASIGDVSILKIEACTNQGFQSLIPKEGNDNEFIYYLMLTLKNVLVQFSSGSTFLEISPNKLKAIEIMVPEPVEQSQIAQILANMDAEIEQLEQKLAKQKMIKQGMMQVLLTGKIRLV